MCPLVVPASYPQQGFLPDNRGYADYNTTVNSWLEQRTYITNAPKVLSKTQPKAAADLQASLDEIQNVKPPSMAGFVKADLSKTYTCGHMTVAFDSRGAITTLSSAAGPLASATNPMGLLKYQTFTNEDYNVFLQDFAARINGCHYKPGEVRGSVSVPPTQVSFYRRMTRLVV